MVLCTLSIVSKPSCCVLSSSGSWWSQVTPRAQPAWACCLSWPTDPLSVSYSSTLPRRASGGGKEKTENRRGGEIREWKQRKWKREGTESEGGWMGQERGGVAWYLSAVWGLAKQPQQTAHSLKLPASRSILPATTTQTSANAQICMHTRKWKKTKENSSFWQLTAVLSSWVFFGLSQRRQKNQPLHKRTIFTGIKKVFRIATPGIRVYKHDRAREWDAKVGGGHLLTQRLHTATPAQGCC